MKWVMGAMALLALIFGGFSGRMEDVSAAALGECGRAVTLVIGLAGALCLWSGLMEIAERAGLTRRIAELLSPVTKRLFPGLSDDPATMGIVSLNITANLLGLGNAATPLGLAAMERLREKSPESDAASADMITLVVLNTCSLQLIPTTVAALRTTAGSASPMEIWLPTLAASGASLLVALTLTRICAKLFPLRQKEGK